MRSISFRSILFTTCLASAFILPFTMTKGHAGFEWVPPAEQPKPVVTAPAAAPAPVIQTAPPPVKQAPAAVRSETLIPLEPLPGIDDLAPPMKQQDPQETVIRVRDFETPAAKPLKMEDKQPVSKPKMAEDVLAAPASTETTLPELPALIDETIAPAAPIVKTRIVMPEDAPKTARESYKDVDAPMVSKPKIVIDPAPAVETVAPKDTGESYATIDGFGSDIPLALALSQIVPATYSYSFAESVNVGQRVSWNGGKAWTEVVGDMIEPLNLEFSVDDKVVHIFDPKVSAQIETEVQPIMAKLPPSALIETAAGEPQTQSRRMRIQDPGAEKTMQPEETMAVIKDLATAEPEAQSLETPPASKPLIATVDSQTAAESPVNLMASVEEKSKPVAVSKVKTGGIWEAQKGDSLKRTLDMWSKQAGFDFEWKADHDYKLESDILVTGSFQRAVKSVFSNAMNPSESPLLTLLNAQQDQPGKLIIQDDSAA